MRSDFYPDIQNHDGLRVAVQESQVSLGTMNEAELRAVIEGPPKALGASVDKKLTEKLIRDIGLDPASGRSDEYDIGKLPLLEYALEQAWAKRTGPRIGLRELFRARTGAGGAGERALRPPVRRGAGGGQAPVRQPRHARRRPRGHARPHRHARLSISVEK